MTGLSERIFALRQQNQFAAALEALFQDVSQETTPTDMAFRHHFLGARRNDHLDLPCLLLEGAAHQQFANIPLVTSNPETVTNHPAHSFFPELPSERNDPVQKSLLKNLFAARWHLVQAVASNNHTEIEQHLYRSLELYAQATASQRAVPQKSAQPGFFRLFDDHGWAKALLSVAQDWQEIEDSEHINWDDPALLLLGSTLGYLINREKFLKPVTAVETWVLLAETYQYRFLEGEKPVPFGRLARLVIEKVPGTGLLYADGRYSGYLPLGETFQQGLRNVMTFLRRQDDWTKQGGHEFDFRWRLTPLSPEDSIPQKQEFPALLGKVDGPSAEAAFACAVRAALRNERLDRHLAVTAQFKDVSNPFHDQIGEVGGIREKMLGVANHSPGTEPGQPNSEAAQLRGLFVDTIVLYEPDSHHHPERPVAVPGGTLRLVHAETFEKAYRLLSEHCRLTDRYRAAVLWQTRKEFAEFCFGTPADPTGSYILNDLHLRNQERTPDQKPIPLDDVRRLQLESGDVRTSLSFPDRPAWRANIVADSGIGKTTLLAYIAHQTADNKDQRQWIPLRIQNLASFLDLSSGGDFLAKAVKHVKALLVEREKYLPESEQQPIPSDPELRDWLMTAGQRTEIVWLLDALDQVSDHRRRLESLKEDFLTCPLLLTLRQEAEADARWNELTLDLQPFKTKTAKRYLWDEEYEDFYAKLLFERLPIADDGEPEEGHVLTIPLLLHLLLQLVKDRGIRPDTDTVDLPEFRNRYAIYRLALTEKGGLVDKGCNTIRQREDLRDASLDEITLAIDALEELAWQQIKAGHFDITATGSLYKEMVRHLQRHLQTNTALKALKHINVFKLPTFEKEKADGLQWRHRSFLEFFAGCWLAQRPNEMQSCLRQHALDQTWHWVFRFAFSALEADSDLRTHLKDAAQSCLAAGVPFLLWTIIHEDHLEFDDSLDILCRWLVHRDYDGRNAWENDERRIPPQRPVLTEETAPILARMFRVEETEPWKRRDSRWLHPAWELVQKGLNSEEDNVCRLCQQIRDKFLSEYETRVRQAAARNQGRSPSEWLPEDQGLLQLLPDEWRVQLGLMSADDIQWIRHWPGEKDCDGDGTKLAYEQRRDRFNLQLQSFRANYCLCPPVGWKSLYSDDNRSILPERFELLRKPITNLQFETFDGHRHRVNHEKWISSSIDIDWTAFPVNDSYHTDSYIQPRGIEAIVGTKYGDRSVVKVSWYQATMFSEWLTGTGVFGVFALPKAHHWEVCCWRGHGPTGDESDSIIFTHKKINRVFGFRSNFTGLDSVYEVPNVFGLVVFHGKIKEWMGDLDDGVIPICSVRGASQSQLSMLTPNSGRQSVEPLIRESNLGFRLCRT